MENRVYYGEYSLHHWIQLILKGNIILPDYQRLFVWSETSVATLIDTFTKNQFVPPVTIGAFKKGNNNQNLILDGQQRLTSILLAYLGLFPDRAKYKKALERFASENDEGVDEEENIDLSENVMDWTFKDLLKNGNDFDSIHNGIPKGNYKQISLGVNEDFLKTKFLGFSFLVPYVSDEKQQLRYYSSVFRNINIQGEPLEDQESRESFYYLDNALVSFFKPDFAKSIIIRVLGKDSKLDFVRYLSLLSQYKKDGGSWKIARGYKPKMETYYLEYINSVVGENTSELFVDFSSVFPNKNFRIPFERLAQTIIALDVPKQFNSIIEADMYFFGLVYLVLIEDKVIRTDDKTEINKELTEKIKVFREDPSHSRAPGALKYLKERIDASIGIIKKYIDE